MEMEIYIYIYIYSGIDEKWRNWSVFVDVFVENMSNDSALDNPYQLQDPNGGALHVVFGVATSRKGNKDVPVLNGYSKKLILLKILRALSLNKNVSLEFYVRIWIC